MKFVAITLFCLLGLIAKVSAQESSELPSLLMNEVSLGSGISATEEVIEIVNTTGDEVELTGVILQYKSQTGTNWTTKASLIGRLRPYGRYLVSNYIDSASLEFNGGLSGSSGHLRLVFDEIEIDKIGWGEAIDSYENPVASPDSSQSLKRHVDEDGRFINSRDNLADWFLSDHPTPENDRLAIKDDEATTETPLGSGDESKDTTTITNPESTSSPAPAGQPSRILISEVFPDPVSPQRDSEHEFIELYNPNAFAVQISGYSLESGSSWRYKHVPGSYSLKPGEYLGLLSQDTGLTLPNSGSAVRLLGPGGHEVHLVEYPKAESGMSWAEHRGVWGWTEQTLHQPNNPPIVEENAPVLASNAENIEKRDVEFATKETKSAQQAPVNGTLADVSLDKQAVNNWVLAGVGSVAVLYAIYEYSNDIRIRIRQCRGYFAHRRENRKQNSGRGDNRTAQRYRRWKNYARKRLSTWSG